MDEEWFYVWWDWWNNVILCKKVILCEECWFKLLLYWSKIFVVMYLDFLIVLKYFNGKIILVSYV